MYHFVKSIADAGNSFDKITHAVLDSKVRCDYIYGLLEGILKRGYPDQWYFGQQILNKQAPKKSYDSRTLIYLIRQDCDIKNCRNIVLEDYLNYANMDSFGLLEMIRYRNFTEESEIRARQLVDSLKQEDLIYLAASNHGYAMPFINVNGRYIPVLGYTTDIFKHDIPESGQEYSYDEVPGFNYTRFADGIDVDYRCYYFVSQGYRMNTNVADGAYIFCLGIGPKDIEFIKKLIHVGTCARYILATEKNMESLCTLFPGAICKPLDYSWTENEIQEYDQNMRKNSGPLFCESDSQIWEYYSYDYLAECMIFPGKPFVELYTARPYMTHEIETEMQVCMINLIYYGHTICSDILGPFKDVYNMINRVKFKSFKMLAYRDIVIVC